MNKINSKYVCLFASYLLTVKTVKKMYGHPVLNNSDSISLYKLHTNCKTLFSFLSQIISDNFRTTC